MAKAYDPKNLVVLMYASNSMCTEVVAVNDPKVKKAEAVIDLNKGTWTAPNNRDRAMADETLKIGEGRAFEFCSRWGVIGVYDRTKLGHLEDMVDDGQSATESRSDSD